ncbi:FHA domain-containing protein [Calidifontibacter indicus]|uniref:Type III secretion system (T3SS) inner membrane Yop/YscD-like protein n=1 Tax=Calidifontibacter indicus TaxID=419650 RepID=A0A3D9UP66_9MICO|nr:FHA domain-containing protein [Calidifontibacter indicus]REF31232.1 type III secretion system (T3SS) inner membrane Yop/YscD-like protein [Calidifontibacter indicus]
MNDQQHPGTDQPGGDATARFTIGSDAVVPAEFSGELRLSQSDQAMVDALRPGTALLIAMRGPNSGARFLLDDEEIGSGRHTDSDIFLDDVTVSRRHAVFRRRQQGYSVVDVGSLNGTYVNGAITDAAELHSGDEVQIGKFRFVYFAAPAGS